MKLAAGALAAGLVLASAGRARADDATPAAKPAATEPGRPAIETPGGTPVTFTSTDVAMRVFIARGDVPSGLIPDPFEKITPLPATVRLAPGTYTLEAESPNASTGRDHLIVEHDAPVTVDVRAGNASVKTFGSVFIAAGIVSAILGIVTIVSVAPHDQHFDRFGVGLPLLLGGVGVGVLGVGMTFAGSTDIHAPHVPPGGAPRGVSLNLRF